MRLLICDDHTLLLQALCLALTDKGHTVVATAADPDEAVEAARQHRPDVCVLDVSFPNASGITAIGRIHEASPGTKVVMLSGSMTPELVAAALAEGAQGFVGKEKPVDVLNEALERAYQGHLAVELNVLQEVLRLPAQAAQTEDPLSMLKLLTDREWEIMRCLVDGMTTDQMADELGVQRNTVRTHIHNLLTKLGVHSRLQAAALMAAHASPETWPARMR